MLKQISTYGILLLITMVIARTATLENIRDVSHLYQRNAEHAFVVNNFALRENFDAKFNDTPLLANVNKKPIFVPFQKHFHKKTTVKNHPISAIEQEDIVQFNTENELHSFVDRDELADINEGELGLDRESTINSNLSLLFPRQRIKPKPVTYGFPE